MTDDLDALRGIEAVEEYIASYDEAMDTYSLPALAAANDYAEGLKKRIQALELGIDAARGLIVVVQGDTAVKAAVHVLDYARWESGTP